MRAAWYWQRSTARQSLQSTMLLIALCGLLGAVTLGALAGARRTESAYGRYLVSINASDAWVNVPSPSISLVRKVSSLPGIISSAAFIGIDAQPILHGHVDPDFTASDLTGSYNGAFFRQDKMTLLQGVLPSLRSTDEIAITPPLVREYGVGIGGIVRFQLYNSADENVVPTRRVSYRVVAIVDVPPALTDQFDDENATIVSPAGTKQLHGSYQYSWIGVRLKGGSAGIPALERRLDALGANTGGYPFAIRQLDEVHQQVQDAIAPEALALALFGLLSAIALLVLVGQALSQLFDRLAPQLDVLRSLGFRRIEAIVAASLGAALAIGVGLVLAMAGAAALSPLSPVGPVHQFDPVAGFQFDPTTLLGGAAILFALLAGILVLTAWRSVSRGPRAVVPYRQSRVAHALSQTSVPIVASLGASYALEPRPGRGRTVVWTNLVGSFVAIAAVVAAVVFGASLDGLVSHPDRYGWSWNVLMENEGGYGTFLPPSTTLATFGDGDGPLDKVMAHAPGVRAWSAFGFAQLRINGQYVSTLGLATHVGHVEPPTVSGHALTGTEPLDPIGASGAGPGQIELGVTTLAQLGTHVGDYVRAGVGIDERRLRVVGIVTLPSIGVSLSDHVSLGRGAMVAESTLLSVEGFRHVSRIPQEAFSAIPSTIAITTAHGVSSKQLVHYLLSKELGGAPGQVYDQPRVLGAAVVNAGQMGSEPLVLAVALAVAVLVSLSAAILANTRRRRRELAVLKTLGLSRAQLRGVVTWQTATLLVIAIVVGVPLGIVAGRRAWTEFATTIGVNPITVVPLVALGIGLMAMIAAGVALSSVPAGVAARTPTSALLSSE